LLYCCLPLGLSVHQHFPFIFLALVAHTEMKFGIQIFKNILVKLQKYATIKLYFEYDRAIFDRVMALGLRKIPIICSFRSFSTLWLYIPKWNLIYRFILRISRSGCLLGTIKPILTEIWPLDLEKFQ
jgi:hypothetical protein